MIPLDQITEKEISIRFDKLPQSMQDALQSEVTLGVIEHICQGNHLADEEKIASVQQLVSLVMLGFVHTYDLAKEINDELELNNPKFAAALADEIAAKVFSPLKEDIDKYYRPILPEKTGPSGTADIMRPPVKISVVPDMGEIRGPEPIRIITEVEGPPSLGAIAPLPPIRKVMPEGGLPKSQPPATPPPKPAATQPAPAALPQKNTAPEPSMPSGAGASPAPFILHQESESAPTKKLPDISQKPMDQITAMSKMLQEHEGKSPPPRPARFEVGSLQDLAPKPPSEPKVVHYSEFTPLDPKSPAPSPAPPSPQPSLPKPHPSPTPTAPGTPGGVPPAAPPKISPPPPQKTWIESPPLLGNSPLNLPKTPPPPPPPVLP